MVRTRGSDGMIPVGAAGKAALRAPDREYAVGTAREVVLLARGRSTGHSSALGVWSGRSIFWKLAGPRER